MKKMMRAFTLAELLLCIGIIGIVSAMGMVITKHSTERAYNLYYYTGYINLYNAIADGKASGIDDIPGLMNHAGDLLSAENNVASAGQQFPMLLYSAFLEYTPPGSTNIGSSENGNLNITPGQNISGTEDHLSGNEINGDQEKFPDQTPDQTPPDTEPLLPFFPNIGFPGHGSNLTPSIPVFHQGDIFSSLGITYHYTYTDWGNQVLITMSVPVAKTRENNGQSNVNLYFLNKNPGYLIPIAPAEGSTAPNLQVRRDLLPAYIDDGKVGRNNIVNRDNFNYAKPIYGTYKDAYCSIRGASGSINNVISCADGTYTNIKRTENGTQLNGFLKIASPQKVH